MNRALCRTTLLLFILAAGCGPTSETAGPLTPPTPIGPAVQEPGVIASQPVAPPVDALPHVAVAQPQGEVASPDPAPTVTVATPPAVVQPETVATPPGTERTDDQQPTAAHTGNDNFDLIEAMLSQYKPKDAAKPNQK